ncbi:hypothetical protein WMY93_015690 [Mugilogobius chulae]|uniref:Uncharacterized protein n=1 Tax=Mugilogobius chulae TaxID=88201 RepID=A0AAW0NX94_9GOBI
MGFQATFVAHRVLSARALSPCSSLPLILPQSLLISAANLVCPRSFRLFLLIPGSRAVSSLLIPGSRAVSSLLIPGSRAVSSLLIPGSRAASSLLIPGSRAASSLHIPGSRAVSSLLIPGSREAGLIVVLCVGSTVMTMCSLKGLHFPLSHLGALQQLQQEEHLCVSDLLLPGPEEQLGLVLALWSESLLKTLSLRVRILPDGQFSKDLFAATGRTDRTQPRQIFGSEVQQNKLQLNISKTPSSSRPITIQNAEVEVVSSYKYLGLQMDDKLNWSVCKKAIPGKVEDIETLEAYIDFYYERQQNSMDPTQTSANPTKKRKTDSSTDTDDLVTAEEARSMRDNLIFSGIPETNNESAENVVKDFIKNQLKIPEETLRNITFHRVHRFGKSTHKTHRPSSQNSNIFRTNYW